MTQRGILQRAISRFTGHKLAIAFAMLSAATTLSAQITPSQDAYTDSAKPTENFGAAITLGVTNTGNSIQTSYIQFDLSSIPAGYTGSNVAKATLKMYVNTATTGGSFNLDFVNGSWSENKITANLAPALGSTIAASVPLTSSNKNDYINVDITSAVQAWLNGTVPNDGIALVANNPISSTFDSKENTKTSHSPELDVVFAGSGGGGGTITGVLTASGSGLMGGGTSGTLNLSLINTCSTGQILSWNGSAWACTTIKGTGTVTSVGSGLGLTGGPITTSGTLSIDTNVVPQLGAVNTFTAGQQISAANTDGLDSYTSVTNGTGLGGFALANTGSGTGVTGATLSPSGFGVFGLNGTTGGVAVMGSSPSGVGVSGASTSGTGVLGTSSGGIAVWGKGTSGSSGVVGASDSGIGVEGTSSFAGLYGLASGAGLGTVGISDSGIGVYGHSNTGYAFDADGHASQARTNGGWVKAMVYVNPTNGGIKRCFNSQLNAPAAATPPCGMTFTREQAGNYTLDFGFVVNDRFASLALDDAPTIVGTFCRSVCLVTPTANQLQLLIGSYTNNQTTDPGGFYVVVY